MFDPDDNQNSIVNDKLITSNFGALRKKVFIKEKVDIKVKDV